MADEGGNQKVLTCSERIPFERLGGLVLAQTGYPTTHLSAALEALESHRAERLAHVQRQLTELKPPERTLGALATQLVGEPPRLARPIQRLEPDGHKQARAWLASVLAVLFEHGEAEGCERPLAAHERLDCTWARAVVSTCMQEQVLSRQSPYLDVHGRTLPLVAVLGTLIKLLTRETPAHARLHHGRRLLRLPLVLKCVSGKMHARGALQHHGRVPLLEGDRVLQARQLAAHRGLYGTRRIALLSKYLMSGAIKRRHQRSSEVISGASRALEST